MPSIDKHIIRSLSLEVEFQDSADAFELRNTLTDVCKSELLPALENLFDEKNNRGKIIRAEKIVIDLGVIDKEGWRKTLVEQVIAQLTSHFSQASPLLSRTNHVRKRHASVSNVKENISANVTEISTDENIIESIFYFLRTGLLPWYTVIKSRGEFTQYFTGLLRDKNNTFHSQILAVVQQDEQALVRLVDQVPDEVTESLLALSGVEVNDVRALLNCWREIFNRCGITRIVPKSLVYFAAVRIVNQQSMDRPFTDAVSEHIIRRIEGVDQQKILKLFSAVPQPFKLTFKTREKEHKVMRFIEKRVKEKNNREGEEKNIRQENRDKVTNGEIKVVPENSTGNKVGNESREPSLERREAKALQPRKNIIRDIAENTDEGFYIANAGLVILNPFLVRLFENVGYLEEKKWISKDHQQRAVLLTQYLVTGKQEYPEFDLLLNKVLTGYPLEESLPSEIVLSDFEMKEGQDVLQSVIQHWKALKNTSIPGLQATFFQREGKLQYHDDQWLLKVEQQTVDILLNKLPWGISIVKFPWMENRLHVEWD